MFPSLVMQVTKALHSSPLTAKDAATADLVDGARFKPDALQTLLHSAQTGGNPAAVFAAKPSSVIYAVVQAVSQQSRQNLSAHAPVKTISISDGSFDKHAEVSTPAAPESNAAKTSSSPGLCTDVHVPAAQPADNQTLSVVARVEAANLTGSSNRQAAIVTDTGESVNVTRTKLLSVQKYIQVRSWGAVCASLFASCTQALHDIITVLQQLLPC